MKVINSCVDEQAVSKRITRSRFHYRPISSAELLLTIGLSTFVGVGVFIATVINTQTSNAYRQTQLSTTEQYINLLNTDLSANA